MKMPISTIALLPTWWMPLLAGEAAPAANPRLPTIHLRIPVGLRFGGGRKA